MEGSSVCRTILEMLEPDKRKLPIALGGLRDSPGSPPARASPLHLPPPKCQGTSQLSQFNRQQVSPWPL